MVLRVAPPRDRNTATIATFRATHGATLPQRQAEESGKYKGLHRNTVSNSSATRANKGRNDRGRWR